MDEKRDEKIDENRDDGDMGARVDETENGDCKPNRQIPEENQEEKPQAGPATISEPDGQGVRYYNIQRGQPKKHRLRKGLIIFGCVILAVIVLGVSCNKAAETLVGGLSLSGAMEKETALPDRDYIATLYVEGTIAANNTDYFGAATGYQHQWTLDKIDELMYDGNNKGIILFVNSPGGGVYESDELYFKIKEYRKATGNPVYSAMGSMAASGGYYISAPCDKIIANRNCWTGSIGVTIGTLFDFSELFDRYGVKTKTITSGANKAMGSSVDPLTKEQQDIFQGLVDEAYEQFTGIVAEGRKMDINKVKKIADGRIYTAKQALDIGLIDKIGTLAEAEEDMKQAYGLSNCQVVDVVYESTPVLGGLLGKLENIGSGSSDLAIIKELVDGESRFPVSYMCEALVSK